MGQTWVRYWFVANTYSTQFWIVIDMLIKITHDCVFNLSSDDVKYKIRLTLYLRNNSYFNLEHLRKRIEEMAMVKWCSIVVKWSCIVVKYNYFLDMALYVSHLLVRPGIRPNPLLTPVSIRRRWLIMQPPPRVSLTHWGQVTHICVTYRGHHWFIYLFVALSAQSHYLNQCRDIVNWPLKNKLQWNVNRNAYNFITKMHLKI